MLKIVCFLHLVCLKPMIFIVVDQYFINRVLKNVENIGNQRKILIGAGGCHGTHRLFYIYILLGVVLHITCICRSGT
jgi:hypothetical protein